MQINSEVQRPQVFIDAQNQNKEPRKKEEVKKETSASSGPATIVTLQTGSNAPKPVSDSQSQKDNQESQRRFADSQKPQTQTLSIYA